MDERDRIFRYAETAGGRLGLDEPEWARSPQGDRVGVDASPPVQWIPVNVWETSHAVVVAAPMPGVTNEDVYVSLTDGRLVIAAELRAPARRHYTMREWDYGSYRREIDLPPAVGAPVTASLGNGILAVSVAKLDGVCEAAVDTSGRIEVQPAAAGASDAGAGRPRA